MVSLSLAATSTKTSSRFQGTSWAAVPTTGMPSGRPASAQSGAVSPTMARSRVRSKPL